MLPRPRTARREERPGPIENRGFGAAGARPLQKNQGGILKALLAANGEKMPAKDAKKGVLLSRNFAFSFFFFGQDRKVIMHDW